MKKRLVFAGTAALLAVGTLSACGANDDDTLLVGATPAPHAQILEFVRDNLAADAGLDLEVKEFTEYTQINPAVESGDLDANYFQTPQYLEEFNKGNDADLVSVASIHAEPMGVYSSKITSIEDIPDGGQVSIPNDASNGARALKLLEAAKVITLSDKAGDLPTEDDVADNPKHLVFDAQDAANLPRALDDSDLAVINGNFAVEAGLSPADALAAEAAKDNPYANLLVVAGDKADDPQVKKLADLLTSPEVKKFIEDTFKDGSVVPVF